jgi:GNAT superfamily N-acetyltransferase
MDESTVGKSEKYFAPTDLNRPYKGDTMLDDIKKYQALERLKNGRPVTIRAIRAEDKEKIAQAFQDLEPESIYTRLFTYKKELTDGDLKRLTEIDYEREVGLVVTLLIEKEEIIIGSGRYFAFDGADGRLHAEVAFLVEEDYQGQGMARMILSHLAAIARSRGIAFFEAEVLPGNKAMLTAFARSGLPMKQRHAGDFIQVTLSLTEG